MIQLTSAAVEAMALGYALTELLYTDLSSGLTNWI